MKPMKCFLSNYFVPTLVFGSLVFLSAQSVSAQKNDALFQAGTLISLLQGVYEGDVDFKELGLRGDTGLGTFNGVDGEMIGLDGHYYRIDVNGVAAEVPSETQSPFAAVSHFQPTIHFDVQSTDNLEALCQMLDDQLDTFNIFYMMRLEVELDSIQLRSVACQTKPYRPLIEVLPEIQRVFELTDTKGTLVCLRSPKYSDPLNVPGYHFHYIDQDRKTGGHVFNLKLKKAKVSIQPIRHWNIALMNNALFDRANLEENVQKAVQKVEKSDNKNN